MMEFGQFDAEGAKEGLEGRAACVTSPRDLRESAVELYTMVKFVMMRQLTCANKLAP